MSGVRTKDRTAATTVTPTRKGSACSTPIANLTRGSSSARQPRNRETLHDLVHFGSEPRLLDGIRARVHGIHDDSTDRAHLGRAETAGRRGRRPDANPR